jgi:metal-responsive CopG/Arc/MetJ family transcriptional regulator
VVVRLPPDLAQDLAKHAALTRKRRSDILREALRSYLRPAGRATRAAERVAHLIGSLETGKADLAANSRRYVLESLTRGR